MTTREAAVQWGVTERQVQLLCKKGAVGGAVRFNRVYAIPRGTPKPRDSRRAPDAPRTETPSPQTAVPEIGRFREILDRFPYRINISDAEGYMVYANQVFMEGTMDGVAETELGRYNILREEMLEAWGLTDHIRRAFAGETVYTPNLEFPNRAMVGTRYKKEYAFLSLYHDVSSFPLFEDGRLLYVVTVFVPVRRLSERREVQRGREYIEAHWHGPYSADSAAAAAGLSVSRFNRLFRGDAGFTPRAYHAEIRFGHLKAALLDPNLSVAEAFAACGMDYNSHYVTQFTRMAGCTPTQYRKNGRSGRPGALEP